MILHLVDAGSGTVVYVDAREEHMSPDDARVLARKLLELAHKAEHPTTASEWP